jgi:hypothetical protein
MMKMLIKVKDRLSHVSADSWHWKITKEIFGSKAHGKTCTYYWFKVPLSMLALTALVIITFLYHTCRIITVVVMWFFGRTFNANISNLDMGVTEGYNYTDYKEHRDGSRYRIAPWEIALFPVLAWLVWFLAVVHPQAGKIALLVVAAVVTVMVLIYLISVTWKFVPIARARAEVKAAWDKVCPPLYIDYTEKKASKE